MTSDNIFKAMIKPINTSGIIIMGAYTLLWGFWVGSPLWDVFDRAPMFQVMSIMPELFWGGIALLVGAMMVYGVIRQSYRSLLFGSFAGFSYWMIISIMYFLGDWQNAGGITALMVAVYCGFIWINIRLNRDRLPFRRYR